MDRASTNFARMAYELGVAGSTGVLSVDPQEGLPELVLVRNGGALTLDLDALGRHASIRLERLAALEGGRITFHAGAVEGGERALPLARWARQHFEHQLDLDRSVQLIREIGDEPVSIREGSAPDPAYLDPADRRLVAALARPRHLRELATIARIPRYRLLAFIHFLRSVGALRTSTQRAHAPVSRTVALKRPSDARHAALHQLGLPADADALVVRKTFRRLAQATHPDRHPEAGETKRRELERRFARLTAAYAQLTTG